MACVSPYGKSVSPFCIAWRAIRQGISHSGSDSPTPAAFLAGLQLERGTWGPMAFVVALLLAVEFGYLRRHPFEHLTPQRGWGRPLAVSLGLTLLILCFGVSYGGQFIYFQF